MLSGSAGSARRRPSSTPVRPGDDASERILQLVRLDRTSAKALHRQLYEQLRRAILLARLQPGQRLPATRSLADELGVSRNTVLSAFDQLLAEGYVAGRVGAGTYVAASIPDNVLEVTSASTATTQRHTSRRLPSARGTLLAGVRLAVDRDEAPPRPFRAALPDLDLVPLGDWLKTIRRCLRLPPRDLLSYGDAGGYAPLRRAIAEHVVAKRAVVCAPEQVLIVSGSQQGLALAANVLLDTDETAWMEDPGYVGARAALTAAGVRLLPVPVDGEGLDVEWARTHYPHARLAYVTPSHQYPTGVTMSLARRLQLLEWAQKSHAWIVEDDYDGEYRYGGRPLESLHGLDRIDCVLYLGTFSKILFPALRLGYLVVPPDLIEVFRAAKALVDRHPPLLDQAILADFIEEGHLGRHVRRMRALYAARQEALRSALGEYFGDLVDAPRNDTGMHLAAWLPGSTDDRALAEIAQAHGIVAVPVSANSLEHPCRPGLVLGFAAFEERQIRNGVRKLAAALEPHLQGAS